MEGGRLKRVKTTANRRGRTEFGSSSAQATREGRGDPYYSLILQETRLAKFQGRKPTYVRYVDLTWMAEQHFEFPHEFEAQGAVQFLELKGQVYPALVREFYANFRYKDGSYWSMISGRLFELDENLFMNVGGLSSNGYGIGDCAWVKETFDAVAQSVPAPDQKEKIESIKVLLIDIVNISTSMLMIEGISVNVLPSSNLPKKEENVNANANSNTPNSICTGNQAMADLCYVKAIDMYACAIALWKNNPIFFCNRGAALTKVCKFWDATCDCYEAIRLEPRYVLAYYLLGCAYFESGKNIEAIGEGFTKGGYETLDRWNLVDALNTLGNRTMADLCYVKAVDIGKNIEAIREGFIKERAKNKTREEPTKARAQMFPTILGIGIVWFYLGQGDLMQIIEIQHTWLNKLNMD
ncbi:unnamed protein product [Lupinus luteus]|uniref:Uncharacterized protein n=1 Tax=Lupinus luteus TaxID=3873 RepID=A0AAV1WJT4_LUPLU